MCVLLQLSQYSMSSGRIKKSIRIVQQPINSLVAVKAEHINNDQTIPSSDHVFIPNNDATTSPAFCVKSEQGAPADQTVGVATIMAAPDIGATKIILTGSEDSPSVTGAGTLVYSNGQLFLIGGDSGHGSSQFSSHLTSVTSINESHAHTVLPNSKNGSTSVVLPRPVEKHATILPADSLASKNQGTAAYARFVKGREEKRRSVHNEVERKRRDKINNWILRLAKHIPGCSESQLKANSALSKAGILSKAYDYIEHLKKENELLSETVSKHQTQQQELLLLREQNNELKNENAILRQQLQ